MEHRSIHFLQLILFLEKSDHGIQLRNTTAIRNITSIACKTLQINI